jgi:hypothetical protein
VESDDGSYPALISVKCRAAFKSQIEHVQNGCFDDPTEVKHSSPDGKEFSGRGTSQLENFHHLAHAAIHSATIGPRLAHLIMTDVSFRHNVSLTIAYC